MDEQNDYSKQIYRQDYHPYRRFFIIGVLLVAAAAVYFIFINKGNDSTNPMNPTVNPNPSALARQQGETGNTNPGTQDNTGGREDNEPYEEGDGNRDSDLGEGELTKQLSAEFDTTGPETTKTPEAAGTDSTVSPAPDKRAAELFGESDKNSAKLFKKATGLFVSGDYKQALLIYQDLAALDQRVEVYVGACYFKMKNYHLARHHLDVALTANSKDVMAMNLLSRTYYELDQLEMSLKYAEKALDIRGDSGLQSFRDKLKREIETMKGYGQTERVNFNVSFSKIEHSAARSLVIEHLEDAYREIGRRLDFYPSHPISVILYNERGFFDVTRSPGWAGALFDGKIRLPIHGFEGHESELKRILFHEYTHALISLMTGSNHCPTWVHEGLAEYFSNDHGQKIGQLIPLRDLDAAFRTSDERLAYAAYVESYSAVSYLIDRYKLYKVKLFLESLGKGNRLEKAFSEAFYISYDRFVETWGKK
ncbi:MAG: hypothetical protein GY940_24870 [bacterium]|nr:hypothetical protein [bacterium]